MLAFSLALYVHTSPGRHRPPSAASAAARVLSTDSVSIYWAPKMGQALCWAEDGGDISPPPPGLGVLSPPIRALLPRKTLLWLPLLWAGSSFPGWPVTTQQPSGQLPVPHSLPLCLVALELPQMPAGPVPTGSLFPPSPAHHQHLHGARSEPPHKDQPCSSLMPGAPHSYPSKTLLHVLPFPWVHCK